MRLLRPSSAALLAATVIPLLGLPHPAAAETRLFLFGAGLTNETLREEDDLLSSREVREWEAGWQLGAGLRIHSDHGQMVGRAPKWETRIRLGYVSGNLADVRYHFARSRAPIYDWTSVEQTEITGLLLGATVHARVHPSIGVFLGPTLERISLRADYERKWNGTVPDYYNGTIYGGDRVADAEGTDVYGSLEIGTRIDPAISPIGFEIYWVPIHIPMSTTQTVDADQYKADFATLEAAWGLRATYDF